jgi:endonuclease-3
MLRPVGRSGGGRFDATFRHGHERPPIATRDCPGQNAGPEACRRTAGPVRGRALRTRLENPLQLLVATILSAQATDVSVNKVTPALFAAYPTAQAFARASPAEIEPFIRSIGLFRSKAKSIHDSCKMLVERFGGEVPRTMDELLQLRGVARKTANVVLGNCFNINVGFVVDTHIQRLAIRFGLAKPGENPQKIEQRLMALLPQDRWCELSHQFIWHGRRACKARGVACDGHPICSEFGTACELRVSAKKNRTRSA